MSMLLNGSKYFMMGSRMAQKMSARAQQQCRMMSVITLSDLDATEKFVDSPKSIVYFTAVWCPPCKLIKKPYEELSDKYPGVNFGKVDVDDNNEAAQEFQISAVPTFILFENGDLTERFSGADTAKLEELVKDLDES